MEAKKIYSTPLLISHGDVDEITKQGGNEFVDAPIGTPVDGDVTNVAES